MRGSNTGEEQCATHPQKRTDTAALTVVATVVLLLGTPGLGGALPAPRWFEERLAVVTAASGVMVELGCRVQESPSPVVTWRRLDGKMAIGCAAREEQRPVVWEGGGRRLRCVRV